MTLSPGVALAVLAAALLHASWNALIRGAGDKRRYTLLLHACSAMISGVSLMFTGLPAPESWPFLAASVVIHSGYILLLIKAYDGGQLATSYTLMRGLPPLIVALLSGPLLGERLGMQGVAGIALISCGVIGIGFASSRSFMRVLSHPSTHAAALNALAIAAYTLIDGQGARLAGNPLAYVFCLCLLEPIGALLWALRGNSRAFRDYVRSHWRLGLLGAFASTLAYGTILWAMTRAPIAMVAALRESSVIFAVMISAVWFKEGHLRRGIIAGIIMIFGVFLIRN